MISLTGRTGRSRALALRAGGLSAGSLSLAMFRNSDIAGSRTGGALAAIVLAISIMLAGCATDPPPPVVLTVAAPAPLVAPECTAEDRERWAVPEDRDQPASHLSRIARTNRAAFDALVGKRAVCRASLAEQFSRRPANPKPTP